MSNLQGFQQWLLKNVHLLCLLQILTVCTHTQHTLEYTDNSTGDLHTKYNLHDNFISLCLLINST